jgi:hypothetical protein
MRIDNATHWRSDQIRALALKVAETELDPGRVKGFTVRVRYGHRGPSTSGHAMYHSRSCQVNVGSDQIDVVNMAHTLAHEMAHTRGLRHRAMRGSIRYRYVTGWREFYAWAKEFPIEQRAEPVTPTVVEKRERRVQHAERMAVTWERKARLATARAKRWRVRARVAQRYIERAAQGPPKEVPPG